MTLAASQKSGETFTVRADSELANKWVLDRRCSLIVPCACGSAIGMVLQQAMASAAQKLFLSGKQVERQSGDES